MYVGPWQEYKLMRLINEVKAENKELKRQMGGPGTSGSSNASSTGRRMGPGEALPPPDEQTAFHNMEPYHQHDMPSASARSNHSTQSAALMSRGRYGGGGDGAGTPSEVGSVRSAPSQYGGGSGGANSLLSSGTQRRNHGYQHTVGGTAGNARALLDSMVRGPPSSHELEDKAHVGQRAPLMTSTSGRGGQPQIRSNNRTGAAPAKAAKKDAFLSEEDKEERVKRRAMLSMLYGGGGGDGDGDENMSDSRRNEILQELEVGEQARQRRMGQQRGGRGAVTQQHRRQASASRQRRPSSSSRPASQPNQQPQPSNHVQNLVNRNIMKDLAAGNESQQQALAPAAVPWDTAFMGNLGNIHHQPQHTSAQPSSGPAGYHSTSGYGGNNTTMLGAGETSPTMLAFLDEQRRRVELNSRGEPRQQQQQPQGTRLPFQDAEYKHNDHQQHYRQKHPYDNGVPVRPVVGDVGGVHMAMPTAHPNDAMQQQQHMMAQLQMDGPPPTAALRASQSNHPPPSNASTTMGGSSPKKLAATGTPTKQQARSAMEASAMSHHQQPVSSRLTPPAPMTGLQEELLSVEAMRGLKAGGGTGLTPPPSTKFGGAMGGSNLATPEKLSSPYRPLRTEPQSGLGNLSPGGTTRRPLSTATDASIGDLDVGGLLQWTSTLGQRDSWGRLPGDPRYGEGAQ